MWILLGRQLNKIFMIFVVVGVELKNRDNLDIWANLRNCGKVIIKITGASDI